MPAATDQRFRDLAPDSRPEPRTPYDSALAAFLDDAFATSPIFATQMGYHAHDDQWPDLTEDGMARALAMFERHHAALSAIPDGELQDGEAIDRGITLEAIDSWRFQVEVLQEHRWDPLTGYVYHLGTGLFTLLAREYAPWQHRGSAALGRIRGIPQFLQAARTNLTGTSDGRPVSLLHTETALSQLDGVAELIDETIAEAGRQANDADGEALRDALEAAAPAAREALDAFRRLLADEVTPRAEGEGRLGSELFQQKLRHTLASDVPYAELLSRARRDYEVVRGEMVRIARAQWPVMFPGDQLPDASADGDSDATIVRRVLAEVAKEHRQPDELLEWCLAENGRIEAFCREHEVIGLPDEPLKITWTPLFMRAYGGAFLDAPGPLDKGQSSYFWITPPGADWPPERVESYLREDNDRMLSLLVIHEGVPGHYLQLAWSNKTPNLTRSIFASGMFAEGWAVYVTQVMMDLGYGDNDPRLWLTHWKFYLRAITNAIMDVLIHTEGLTEEQAMELMVKGGFQEQQEATAKWLRARLTSTQLSTYYLGSDGMWELDLEARRRAAAAAGGDTSAVSRPRVVGGLGDTPGFVYREHLEAVISHGTPPIKWLKRILFPA
jgi:uncharacterized protein (DUF885 family)